MHDSVVVQENDITFLPLNVNLNVFCYSERQLKIRGVDGRSVTICRKRMVGTIVALERWFGGAMVSRTSIC